MQLSPLRMADPKRSVGHSIEYAETDKLKDLRIYDHLVCVYLGTDITKVVAAWKASIRLLETGMLLGSHNL